MRRKSSWIALLTLLALAGVRATQASGPAASSPSPTSLPADSAARAADRPSFGRSFLIAGAAEERGYRAYSYVLLAPSADAANSSANEATLSAFLGLEDINRVLAAGADAPNLKIVYLPLTQAPPSNASLAWYLAHFDHARADTIRNVVSESEPGSSLGPVSRIHNRPGVSAQPGPALVSYISPLSDVTTVDQNKLLIQDLSGGPAAFVPSLEKQLSPDGAPNSAVRGDHRFSGRDYLRTGKPEDSGYGLYSYILFGETMNSGNHDLYRAVLDAFMSIQEVRRYEEDERISRTNLNVTYLPLNDLPPSGATVDWLLDHYDYARAQIILSKLMDRFTGPYIVSYSAPLSSAASVEAGRILVEDLSRITPDLAFLWFNEFTTQAGRPQYWDKPALRNLMVNLRTQVAVAAQAFDEVRTANGNLTAVFESRIKIKE